MRKNSLVNLLLVIVSLLITLILAEFGFRKIIFGSSSSFEFLRNPSNYALYYHDSNEDFYNEDYWKLNYLFGRGFEMNDPHPLLGWAGFFNKENYDQSLSDKTQTKRPVLLYGDSFAMCVDSVQCFDDILNGDSLFGMNHVFLNYGVGGYGLDQIYLLFHESVRKYHKPFIVFSMLTTDLDRSMLKVRDGQKPYFTISNDTLQLNGIPITLTSKEYFAQNKPEITSYLWNKLVNASMYNIIMTENGRLSYIEKIKALNEKILEKTFAELKSLNTDYLILIFQPAWHNPEDWRLQFIKDVCSKNNVSYVCDKDLREVAMKDKGYSLQQLFIPNDGHPTSLANRIVSEEIKKIVLEYSGSPHLKKNTQE